MSPFGASHFAGYIELPTCSNCEKAKRVKATDEGESPRNTGIWLLAVFTFTICWFEKYFPGVRCIRRRHDKNWQLGLKLTIACIISYIFIANGCHIFFYVIPTRVNSTSLACVWMKVPSYFALSAHQRSQWSPTCLYNQTH